MVTAPFVAVSLIDNRDPVIIIGAGPTGLVSALILTELGVPVEIFDRNPGPANTWRAPGFNARTMELFSRYGLAERFLSVGEARDELAIYADGKQIAQLSMYGGRTEFPHMFLCPQTETERVLRDRLAELGVYVQWGWEFVSYDTMDSGYDAKPSKSGVIVRLRNIEMDYNRPQTRVCRGAYLIGCDGAHSRVRKAIGAAFDGRRMDVKIATGDVEVDADWPSAGRFTIHPDGIVGALRVRGSFCYRVFAVWTDKDPEELTPETFSQVLRKRLAPEPLPNLRVLSTSLFTLQERRASHYVSGDGYVFLCGDAAHVHSPAGGQGLNMGVQDAENLCWKLAMVYLNQADPVLLSSYATERIPVADEVILGSHKLFNATMATSSMKTFVLKHAAPFFASAPRKMNRKRYEQVAQLRICYTTESIAVTEDVHKWENAWWASLLTDDLCVPGARALDGVVTDLTDPNQRIIRLRDWGYEHKGSYTALVFIDCGATATGNEILRADRPTRIQRAGSNASLNRHANALTTYANHGRIARAAIDDLMLLAATLRDYRRTIPMAIILHGGRTQAVRDSVAQQIYEHFPSTYDSEFDDAPSPLIRVFGDLPQGEQYDDLTLAGLYACAHSGNHVVYLIRPDAYVACRGPLHGAGDRIQEHLDGFMRRV